MSTDPQILAANWGRLISAVARPGPDADRDAHLSLAMSLGSALTPDGLACSVTQFAGGVYFTPVWSNQVALDLDRAQYESGEGPCVATAADGRAHTITVMLDEPLYPAFTAAAVRRGVRCSLSLPVGGPDAPSALNLYARTASAYDAPRARATAELLARCVGALLAPIARGRGTLGSVDGPALPDGSRADGTSTQDPGGSDPTGSRGAVHADHPTDVDGIAAPDVRDRAGGVDGSDVGPALARALDRRRLIKRAQDELIRRGAPGSERAFVRLTELSRSEQRSIFAVARDLVSTTAGSSDDGASGT